MSFAKSLESLKKVELSELDLNNIGVWPAPVKFIFAVILFVVVLFLGYHFHLQDH